MISQQQQTNEELCNLLVQSLIAKDEKLLQKILEQEDELIIKDIINRVPVNHVRKLVIELRNILSNKLTVNHLQWLQHLLAIKYSVLSSMADGRSILIPLISLLNDRSEPSYYNKMLTLKGKINLLKQLRAARRVDIAETVVRVDSEPDQQAQMEIDSETDSESDEDLDEDDGANVDQEHEDNNEEEEQDLEDDSEEDDLEES